MFPTSFSGTDGCDPATWLENFNLYCQFRGLNEDGRRALFQLTMKDVAAMWLKTVPDEDRNQWNTLTTTFMERFALIESGASDKMKKIWTAKQGQTEPVRNYIDRVKALSAGLELADTVLVSAIEAGFKPEIRQFVARQQPKTMKTLLESAMLAERTAFPEATIPDALSNTLHRLEQKLDSVQLAAISRNDSPSRHHRPDSDANNLDPRYAGNQRSGRPPSPMPPSNYRSGNINRSGRSPSPHRYRQPQSPVQSTSHYPRQNFEYQGTQSLQPPPSWNMQPPPAWNHENGQAYKNLFCYRCNGTNHTKFLCRHKFAKCRYCSALGHIERACRKRQAAYEVDQ